MSDGAARPGAARPRAIGVIACEVFTREVCALVASSPEETTLRFLPKGMHNLPCTDMQTRIQEVVDEMSQRADLTGIALAYGLCNRGLEHIQARRYPLAMIKAHDCIGIMLGSVRRHRAELTDCPGTYFLSSGWLEHASNREDLRQLSIERRNRMDLSREELVKRYGEENADYIQEKLGQAGHYTRCAYIDMGVHGDDAFADEARRRADGKGWRFARLPGDPGPLRRLLHGVWDGPDILVIPPGHRTSARFDDEVIGCTAGEDHAQAPL